MESPDLAPICLPPVRPCSAEELYMIDDEGIVRDGLVAKLVSLKSLLRLDADGIAGEALESELRATRDAIVAFETVLVNRKLVFGLEDMEIAAELGDVFTSGLNDHSQRDPVWHDEEDDDEDEEVDEEEIDMDRDSPRISISGDDDADDVFDSIPPPDMSSSSVESSPRLSMSSSWQSSSPMSISTTATSISPRESLALRRRSCIPAVSGIFDDDKDHDMVSHWEDHDESFSRLSRILASLQEQAEAAVGSPNLNEDEDEKELLPEEGTKKMEWPITPITTAAPKIDEVDTPASTKTITAAAPAAAVWNARSLPSTPLFTPRALRRDDILFGLGLPPTNVSKDGELGGRRTGSPVFLRRRNKSWDMIMDIKRPKSASGMVLRRRGPPAIPPTPPTPKLPKLEGPGVEEEKEEREELDLEQIVAELLDQRLAAAEGEQMLMFRWVWMWLAGGGILWAAVGWILRWGCNECVCVG